MIEEQLQPDQIESQQHVQLRRCMWLYSDTSHAIAPQMPTESILLSHRHSRNDVVSFSPHCPPAEDWTASAGVCCCRLLAQLPRTAAGAWNASARTGGRPHHLLQMTHPTDHKGAFQGHQRIRRRQKAAQSSWVGLNRCPAGGERRQLLRRSLDAGRPSAPAIPFPTDTATHGPYQRNPRPPLNPPWSALSKSSSFASNGPVFMENGGHIQIGGSW